MQMKLIVTLACAALSAPLFGGNLTAKIAEKHKVTRTDTFFGFERTVFDFNGHEAWVVEPQEKAAEGIPWTWTMQWATAFVPRTNVPKLLEKGWHHVTLQMFDTRACDDSMPEFKAFQEYLVKDIGFAPKARLVGLSWGGFFSIRYAATYPELVKSIYLDAPLLNFEKFGNNDPAQIGPWAKSVPEKGWRSDPRMPVNMAEPIAKAGIPVLLIYGGVDQVVPPASNCELFIPRFKACGGDIKVIRRGAYAHHPHGIELDDWEIARFFMTK